MPVIAQDFPNPPRISGNPAADLAALVQYLWQFYESAILGGGLIQNTQLASQLQTQFARLYNLAVLADGAANKLPYLTDTDDWALADLTDDARDLLAKDSVAAMLAFLGITIYTDEMVEDVVAGLIANGTGLSWTYNDAAGTLTGDVSITQYTDELARDAIAAFVQNGFGIDWTHDDPGDTLTPAITMPTYTVATVPDAAANARRWIYVSNEAGGAVPAFSDGAAWRRCTDRAIVS